MSVSIKLADGSDRIIHGVAARFTQLGRTEEGRDAVQQLLLLKPNFQQRGQLLIGHFVKFPEIVEQLLEGLSNAGLNLD